MPISIKYLNKEIVRIKIQTKYILKHNNFYFLFVGEPRCRLPNLRDDGHILRSSCCDFIVILAHFCDGAESLKNAPGAKGVRAHRYRTELRRRREKWRH